MGGERIVIDEVGVGGCHMMGSCLTSWWRFGGGPRPTARFQIESKEELKNRLGRSPDRADAVVLAFSGWAPRKARSAEAVHWG